MAESQNEEQKQNQNSTQDEAQEKKDEVVSIRKKLLEKVENGEKLTDEEINRLKYETNEEEISQIDRIIRGVNDVFVKEYDFKEYGLNFTIKIKAPNVKEQGKIQGRREAYLQGMGLAVSPFYYNAFDALATIRVCGVEVPKELQNDDDIYNMYILIEIGRDFGQWLGSFRS